MVRPIHALEVALYASNDLYIHCVMQLKQKYHSADHYTHTYPGTCDQITPDHI